MKYALDFIYMKNFNINKTMHIYVYVFLNLFGFYGITAIYKHRLQKVLVYEEYRGAKIDATNVKDYSLSGKHKNIHADMYTYACIYTDA